MSFSWNNSFPSISSVVEGLKKRPPSKKKEEYTKQLIKAASPGWLKSLSFNNTKENDVNHV